MNNFKKISKSICITLSCLFAFNLTTSITQSHAASIIAHDPSRNVQKEGVGNPFNYGERNTQQMPAKQK